ncbi:MAG TPA: DUF3052 domain-containing protein [Actinomycetota bacterium]|nr:DUF3052 domain-containing protein [Actinomycetota bacterium]
MTAGYSGTPPAKKLGVKEGAALVLAGAPEGWSLPDLPRGVTVKSSLRGRFDVAVVFVRSAAELRRRAAAVVRATPDEAALWMAWPRKAGGHDSDVTEDLLRDLLLPTGLVDVKVAAIDDDWSGLKFVRRKELRARR